MENDKTHNLKIFKKCSSDIEAQMIVDLLEANGIQAIIDNNLPHSILPVSSDAIILVREDDYEQAVIVYNELNKSKNNHIEADNNSTYDENEKIEG